ncbi:hypothetical protein Tsubulata_035159 [Turnera subulata]|uniref:Uncharacterized protein n=1 Tax=Turnera subulata TaxID=218843 RepID=A0A9Q0J282_9ROSI|nr:hypothetical protein Tsubulata_035159 [Turnera subulata]
MAAATIPFPSICSNPFFLGPTGFYPYALRLSHFCCATKRRHCYWSPRPACCFSSLLVFFFLIPPPPPCRHHHLLLLHNSNNNSSIT